MNKEEQFKFIQDNYPAERHHISNRRIRHTIFTKIETELQAYLLGFYAADGSIDEKRKTFRIELQNRDSEIVYLFKDVISNDARLYSNKAKNFMGKKGKMIHTDGSIGVDITSATLCESLVKLGIGYRKTYTDFEIPKDIPQNLIRHFFRGFFDGDGSFSAGTYKSKDRPNPRLRVHFSIDSKKPKILNSFMSFLNENGIKTSVIYLKRDNMFRLNTSSIKECKKLFGLLYNNSNFYLTRKYSNFNHYVNTEVTQLIDEYRNAQEVNVSESNNPPTSVERSEQIENVC